MPDISNGNQLYLYTINFIKKYRYYIDMEKNYITA